MPQNSVIQPMHPFEPNPKYGINHYDNSEPYPEHRAMRADLGCAAFDLTGRKWSMLLWWMRPILFPRLR